MATAEDQEFSFPATTTTDTPPRFIESPPLWRRSSSDSPAGIWKGKEVESDAHQELKDSTFSHNQRNRCSYEDDREEKMDMLWEDLNEEFSRRSGKLGQSSDLSSSTGAGAGAGGEVHISCIKSLKLSTTNGNMFSGKKPNILLFIKILKKVFVKHKSRHQIKKRSC